MQFVALELLKNANIAAGFILPSCQVSHDATDVHTFMHGCRDHPGRQWDGARDTHVRAAVMCTDCI